MRKSSFALASFLILGVVALGAAAPLGPLAGQAALAAAGDTLVVTGDGVNVRFGPSTNTRIRQRVPRDQQVMELQREGDWVRVEIVDSDGREGWIHGSLLAPPGGEPLVARRSPAAARGACGSATRRRRRRVASRRRRGARETAAPQEQPGGRRSAGSSTDAGARPSPARSR